MSSLMQVAPPVVPQANFTTVFEKLVDATVEQLGGFEELPVPRNAAEVWAGKILFKSRFLRSETIDFRSVLISGPKINIVNMFLFPRGESNLPVYAMEFVVFGKKPIVAVVDVASPVSSKMEIDDILQSAHAEYPTLTQAEDPPEWFQECRSGNDFFVRPPSAESMLEMCSVHSKVFNQLLDRIDEADGDLNKPQPEGQAWVKDYKQHHRLNSPGLPFLCRTFGAAWTDWFLKEHLFA